VLALQQYLLKHYELFFFILLSTQVHANKRWLKCFKLLSYSIDQCIIISELVWDRKMLWQTGVLIPENMSVNFRGL